MSRKYVYQDYVELFHSFEPSEDTLEPTERTFVPIYSNNTFLPIPSPSPPNPWRLDTIGPEMQQIVVVSVVTNILTFGCLCCTYHFFKYIRTRVKEWYLHVDNSNATTSDNDIDVDMDIDVWLEDEYA
jgi:hypothetical protein